MHFNLCTAAAYNNCVRKTANKQLLPIYKNRQGKRCCTVSKILLRMKLIILLIIIICVQANASVLAQEITLSEQNVSLEQVFKEIRRQATVDFIFKTNQLKKASPISINITKKPLEEVLELIFRDQPIDYLLTNKTIIVVDKKDRPKKGITVAETEVEAKQQAISGRITTDNGNPLAGVSVTDQETGNGTTTNDNGEFSLVINRSSAMLTFSYIGYISQTISVNTNTPVSVVLEQDVAGLDEITVVGYGTQRKSDLTGSISSIKGEDLVQLPAQRVDQALQGRAAGVMVLSTDGSPGGNVTIRIRGLNSINGGNNALIVIDGLQGGDLTSLNPNDIESIEVLKDASATAIYGSQGANGVVLITTKRGKTGRPVISYDYNIGIQQLGRKLDLMNAAQYAQSINDFAATRNGSGVEPFLPFTPEQIRNYESTGGTDWQDVIYRTAPLQNHQLSVSGGTENMSYLVSGGYLDHQGILTNSSYKRFSLRANLSADINDWINFGINWAGTQEAGNSPPFGSADVSFLGDPVNVAPRWGPTEPVFNEDGSYRKHSSSYGAYDTWNPLASSREPLIDNNTIRNTVSGHLQFNILAGLSLRIVGGAIINNQNDRNYYNQKTFEGLLYGGLGNILESQSSRYQNSNILTYDKILEKHRLTVTAVAEQQISKFKTSAARGTDFLVDEVGVADLGGANIVVNSSSNNERVINSYLGRINYVFNDRYMLTASYRADGSSVFGKNNKWGYFPSASVAWRASEEAFIKNLNVFSDLKFRLSWGVTGNQAISPYQTLARISSGNNYPYNGGEATDLGFYVASAANPNLRWESTAQTNLGMDLGLFQGKLTATVDYYRKTTDDLLLSRPLPGYTGFSSIIDNIGSIRNQGIEVAVGTNLQFGELSWSSNFNVSTNNNTVLNLGNADRISFRTTKGGYGLAENFMYLEKGQSFGQMYGFGYEGTWTQAEAAEAAAYGQLPGDPKYRDVDDNKIINRDDLMVIGNALPDLIFGWTNSLSYKQFEFSMLWQGTQGNDLFNQSRIRLERPGEGTSSRLLERWTPQNQNTGVPAFIDELTRQEAGLVSTIAIGGDERISRWVEDASYIRLKNIMLSYNIPSTVLDNIGFRNARVFVSATNLLTFTKYSGYDPEVSSFNGNDAQIGVDFSNYPTAKTFTFGVNLTL